jgi:hypothetical protein
MRSGIAGISIVSAYITITAIQLKTMSVFQAYTGTLTDVDITSDDECINEDFFVEESLKNADRNLLLIKLRL